MTRFAVTSAIALYDTIIPQVDPPVRGPEPRAADPPVRPGSKGRGRVSRPGGRDPTARRTTREPPADRRERAGGAGMTVRSERPQGLGRGLAALIPQRGPTTNGSIEIPLARIRENPRQPRLRMDDDALAALAESIREHGVIQPILVTETHRRLSARRGRAPRSRRAARRPGPHSRDRPPARRSRAARARARGEPPARGPRSDRGGPRATASSSTTSRSRRRSSRPRVGPGAVHGREHAAAARAQLRGAGRRRVGRDQRRPRARHRRPAHGDPGPRRVGGHRGRPLGPADRGAGPAPPRASPDPSRGCARSPPPTPTSNASRRTCADRSARRSG